MQDANQYLQTCTNTLCKKIFKDKNLASKCQISYGFPSARALSAKNRAIGEAWQTQKSESIFISPIEFFEGNDMGILGILLHELIHIKVGTKYQHQKPFRAEMERIGLVGIPSQSGIGIGGKLEKTLRKLWFPEMPDLFNKKVLSSTKKSRLLLYVCGCGRKIRMSGQVFHQNTISCGGCNSIFQEKNAFQFVKSCQ